MAEKQQTPCMRSLGGAEEKSSSSNASMIKRKKERCKGHMYDSALVYERQL